MGQTFFDLEGAPVWFTTDGVFLFEYSKRSPIAFFEQGQAVANQRSIFSLSGKYLGFSQENWIYDEIGQAWMFGG